MWVLRVAPPRIVPNSVVTSCRSASALTVACRASVLSAMAADSARESSPIVVLVIRQDRTIVPSPTAPPSMLLRSIRAPPPIRHPVSTEFHTTARSSISVPGPMRQPGPMTAEGATLAPGSISASPSVPSIAPLGTAIRAGGRGSSKANMSASDCCDSRASGATASRRPMAGWVHCSPSRRQPTGSPPANSHSPPSRCARSSA